MKKMCDIKYKLYKFFTKVSLWFLDDENLKKRKFIEDISNSGHLNRNSLFRLNDRGEVVVKGVSVKGLTHTNQINEDDVINSMIDGLKEVDGRWSKHKRKGFTEMRPYKSGEDMSGISLSDADKKLDTLDGGWVARNTKDHEDQWYVAKKYYDENLEAV